MKAGTQKLPNLDILRFFLAAMVVIYHLPTVMKTMGFASDHSLPLFFKGEEAVIFFFSLSGFLIIRLLYIEKRNNPNINIRDFYTRRILRIYPLYYLVLVTGILLYHVILPLAHISKPTDYSLPELIAYYVLLLPNVFRVDHPVGSVLNILWSIGIEEQFYLFIPLIVFFVKRKYLLPALAGLLGIYLIVFFNNPWLREHHFYYYYFLSGGVISILSYEGYFNNVFKYRISGYILVIIFLTFFFTNWFAIWGYMPYHLFMTVFCGFFLSSIGDHPLFIIRNRALNYCGKISYGIYMYHMITLTFILFIARYVLDLRKVNGNLLLAVFIPVTLSLTIFIAHLSYKYLESYFLGLKKKYRHIAPAEAKPGQ